MVHVTVNGRVVDIPSYQCRPGDLIVVRDRKASRQLAEGNLEFPGLANIPPIWSSTRPSSPPR